MALVAPDVLSDLAASAFRLSDAPLTASDNAAAVVIAANLLQRKDFILYLAPVLSLANEWCK
jgi:hypothetical protein